MSDIRPLLGDPDATPAPGMVHTYRILIEGRLDAEILANGRIQLWLDANKVEFETDGDVEPTIQAALPEHLARGAQIELDESGRLAKTHLPKGVHRVAMGLWQVLATRWQWTRPESGFVRWEAREPDVNGEMQVRYVLRPRAAGDGAELERTREALVAGEDTGAESTLASGVAQFSLAAGDGLPVSLSGEDRTELLRSGRPIGVSEETYSLEPLPGRSEREPEASARKRPQPRYELELAKGRVQGLHTRDEMERGRLAGRTPAAVWAAYRKEAKSPSGAKEAYLALKAMLYLYPEECVPAGKALATFDHDPSGLAGIAEALADAGHADARRTLRQALRQLPPDSPGRSMISGAMGALREPDSETLDLLRQVVLEANPAADSAMLALGRLANPKGKSAEFDSDSIVRWLLERFVDPSLLSRRPVIVLALGNTSSPLAESAILAAIASLDPDLRGAAATSLRWMPSDKADAALRKALRNDDNFEVRRKAAGAMSFRQNEGNLNALLDAARDPSPAMRMAAITVLGGWTHDDGRIAACLRQASDDADPDVRKLATALVAARPPVELRLK